jgi:hypothetical protein
LACANSEEETNNTARTAPGRHTAFLLRAISNVKDFMSAPISDVNKQPLLGGRVFTVEGV